jgi:hypothetical protein
VCGRLGTAATGVGRVNPREKLANNRDKRLVLR